MGFFDSLFGTNTTAATNKASGAAEAYQQAVGSANEQMLRGLNLNAQGAIANNGALAQNAINAGAANAAGALTNYGGQAQTALANGVNNAVGTVQGSNALFQPYAATGAAANGLYANSLGLNGAAGNAAATNAFQASPGYQWQVDQATDGAARKAASLGMAASGNTLDAITRLGSNLADQEYGNWQSKLNGLGAQGLQAAGAISGNNAAAAGYQYGGGATGAGLLQQLGAGLGSVYGNQGQSLAGIDQNMGQSIAGLNTTLGQQLSQNSQWKVNGVNSAAIQDANAQDSATNANNKIYSTLIGKALSPITDPLSKSVSSAFSGLFGV